MMRVRTPLELLPSLCAGTQATRRGYSVSVVSFCCFFESLLLLGEQSVDFSNQRQQLFRVLLLRSLGTKFFPAFCIFGLACFGLLSAPSTTLLHRDLRRARASCPKAATNPRSEMKFATPRK